MDFNNKTVATVLKSLAWLSVALIVIATLSPIGLRPRLSDSANLERFAAFGLAGLLLGLAYRRHFLRVTLLMIVLAFGVEAMQRLTADRHGHVADMSYKAIGGLAGIFAAGMILRINSKLARSKPTDMIVPPEKS